MHPVVGSETSGTSVSNTREMLTTATTAILVRSLNSLKYSKRRTLLSLNVLRDVLSKRFHPIVLTSDSDPHPFSRSVGIICRDSKCLERTVKSERSCYLVREEEKEKVEFKSREAEENMKEKEKKRCVEN